MDRKFLTGRDSGETHLPGFSLKQVRSADLTVGGRGEAVRELIRYEGGDSG